MRRLADAEVELKEKRAAEERASRRLKAETSSTARITIQDYVNLSESVTGALHEVGIVDGAYAQGTCLGHMAMVL